MTTPSSGSSESDAGRDGRLDVLFKKLVEANGSDLHLQAGSGPRIRVDGNLRKLAGEKELTEDDTEQLAESLLSSLDMESLIRGTEIDVAHFNADLGRFRAHLFLQAGTIALTFRHIPEHIPSFLDLGLPPAVEQLANEPRGLVLVTGPTGSGKTSTLASMVDHINRTRECHIVTIEDPVEFVHRPQLAELSQREVGVDTLDFPSAMRSAMRQDPDVILVGEMRDAETVAAALHAAETGHLVLSTLHTTDAVETISRIVDFFPAHQHRQTRVTLASVLRGVIGQRLVRRANSKGRIPAVEILIGNGRVQHCILDPDRQGDLSEILSAGDFYGMTTFDQSLARLCRDQLIDADTAIRAATNPHDLKLLMSRPAS